MREGRNVIVICTNGQFLSWPLGALEWPLKLQPNWTNRKPALLRPFLLAEQGDVRDADIIRDRNTIVTCLI